MDTISWLCNPLIWVFQTVSEINHSPQSQKIKKEKASHLNNLTWKKPVNSIVILFMQPFNFKIKIYYQ